MAAPAYQKSRAISYRPDIDGLRAIAVIAVVLYHAFPNFFPGGYIGVDVFFVISGYLISSIIIKQTNEKKFRLLAFWSNRIWRIFPALCLVLLATLTYGAFRLQIDELHTLAKHTISAATFFANFTFIKESGYFDAAAETKPLLHLWSLAIETQFYLIWPIALMLAIRFKNTIWAIVLTLFFVSLIISIYELKVDPIKAFYLPHMRFWELISGTCLALHEQNNRNIATNQFLVKLSALAGALLLATGFLTFSKATSFPGYWALIPVTGTFLLIASGQHCLVSKTILGNRYFASIGLISYPLYLWHVPLLTFLKIESGHTATFDEFIAVICASTILATITYRGLELPLQKFRHNRIATAVLIVFMLIISCGAAYISSLPNNQSQVSAESFATLDQKNFYNFYADLPRGRWQEIFEKNFRHDCNYYRVDDYYRNAPTRIPKPNIAEDCDHRDSRFTHSVFIWGDSYAQMLRGGLEKNIPPTWQILQIASSGCTPSIKITQGSVADYCVQSNWAAKQLVIASKPDVVILAQHDFHSAAILNDIAEYLLSVGVKKVLISGPAPRWLDDLPKLYVRNLWEEKPERTQRGINQKFTRDNENLKRLVRQSDKVRYIDLIGFMCDARGCITRISPEFTNNLTTWDHGHFTETTSAYVVKELILPEILR